MPLDYKRSYKTKLKRRKILTISIIVLVFILASGTVLYLNFRSGDTPRSFLERLLLRKEPEPSSDVTTESGSAGQWFGSSAKRGKALERQPVYLYTVGVARVNPADVEPEHEYVREDVTVDDSYFDDALFIGDSRTEGFVLYSPLSNIHAYCSKGLSVSRIYTDTIVPMDDGRKLTVMEALQEQKFNKIYIMFGVNELGWPYDDLFRDQYAKMLRDIRQLQPDALIYVENIIPIAASRSAKDTIYNNENVARFNTIIESVCEEQDVIFLDVASALADENGALPEDASVDGVHCNAEYCSIWLDFLKNNTYQIK